MKISHKIVTTILVLLIGCQSVPDSDLKQASNSLSKMATNYHLRKSCFSVVYPNGTASDFVNYLFSDLGTAEWPIAFDQIEVEQTESIGQTPLPENVVISHLNRTQIDSKEIVLQADDINRMIIVQGYLPQSNQVKLAASWKLGTAKADQFTQQICQSNLEMGIEVKPR